MWDPGTTCPGGVRAIIAHARERDNGDLTKWTTFWDTFESAVHKCPDLTNIEKFSYLISLLESTAAEAIAGLKLTSANNDEAVATLKQRFGKK